MQGVTRKRWRELCDQAAIEQDPEKLLRIVREIVRMLEEKADRLMGTADHVQSKPN
jgi:hypothetical protein